MITELKQENILSSCGFSIELIKDNFSTFEECVDVSSNHSTASCWCNIISEGIGSSTEIAQSGGQVAQIIGILPGLGAYSGSSSGSSDSSDSEDSDVDTRMFSKRQVCVKHRH